MRRFRIMCPACSNDFTIGIIKSASVRCPYCSAVLFAERKGKGVCIRRSGRKK